MPRPPRHTLTLPLGGLLLSFACAHSALAPAPAPAPAAAVPAVPETVTVRDPQQDRRIAALELQLLAKDAQTSVLSKQVDDARQEVVRSMAKLRTLATRAEAASGMAEAEIAVTSLRNKGDRSASELGQAEQLLKMSSTEFGSENYGGALYLANQAKNVAQAGEERIAGAERLAPRAGEVRFPVPVPLRLVSRGNVREGPGTNFKVLFTLEGGSQVVGHSYSNEWVRIVDDQGRPGWVTRSLVAGR